MALGTKLTVSTLILGTGLIGAYGVANEGFGPVSNGSESDEQIETTSPSNASTNPQQPAAPVEEAEDNEINTQSSKAVSTEESSTLENKEQKGVTGKDPNAVSEPISNHVEEGQLARPTPENTSSRDSVLINVIVN